MTKTSRALLCAAGACLLLASAPPRTPLYGFTAISSTAEYELESRFLDVPSADGALTAATAVAAKPHYAGTDGDYKLAHYVRDALASYGFDASIETFTARIDVPKKLALELIPTGARPPGGPPANIPLLDRKKKKRELENARKGIITSPADGLDLREIPDAGDPDTANPAVGLPFIAGSADGDVTGPLVYAGHGMEGDYALLAAHAVDVRKAVLLIRYGGDNRTALVRRAQAAGAAAVVLYDDPADDGAARGTVYPNGPWRPLTSVQRGSVGEGVTIPVLPVSAANAQLLLAALHGPSAPRPWAGALSVGYPIVRGPATVRVVVELQRKLTTLWNTVGVLHGTVPGQTVIVGAQRDAWVYGIGPGGGGVVTLLEAGRGLGELARAGWHPGRTIVFAAWDGEELGGYGSLAYVHRHGDELRTGNLAYLDTSPAVSGPAFGADAVASIAQTLVEATHAVDDPAQPGNTVYDRYAFRTRGALPPLDRPAGGNDPMPFLFGVGTPTLKAGFTGPFGPYHSSFDTLQFARTIADPDFALHRAVAQIYGVATLRLADADVVPYHFGAYVAPMRAALNLLTAAARAQHLSIDARGFDLSLRRFATGAARADGATARGKAAADPELQLEAARLLDLNAYGIDGSAGITFPDVARALRAGDQPAVDLAVARARTTLERAAALIAQ
jgi:N-acetylated-alpha-linked acidic dipeptidase